MFVWIPRFSYQITSGYHGNGLNYIDGKTSEQGSIEIKFLKGNTNLFADGSGYADRTPKLNGSLESATAMTNYVVHPSFANESQIGYRNGGWDKECFGFWVAKFEASYPSGGNSITPKESGIYYSQADGWGREKEGDTLTFITARNFLDGVYGSNPTKIKCPVFLGNSYSMSYININDAYNIAKAMINEGSGYGLKEDSAPHLTKNSEWGAITYLCKSKYGNEQIIQNNNFNKRDWSNAVFGVTGGNDYITNVNQTTTGNIYGIYDLSGGVNEFVAAYIPNTNNLNRLYNYGKALTYVGDSIKTNSTKYETVYNMDYLYENDSVPCNWDQYMIAAPKNYLKNAEKFGDAMWEISNLVSDYSTWKGNYSTFAALYFPFIDRGTPFGSRNDGVFEFFGDAASSSYSLGFRVVII